MTTQNLPRPSRPARRHRLPVSLSSTPPAWDDAPAGSTDESRLVSLSAAISGLRPLDFLRQARGQERFYWAEPSGDVELAGAGVAAALVAPPVLGDEATRPPAERFAAIDHQVRQLFDRAICRPVEPAGRRGSDVNPDARPRLFGGFAFQDDFVPDKTWATFNTAEFVLPHYQVARRGHTTYLTINALVGPDEPIDETLRSLREALAARLALVAAVPGEPSPPVARRYPMTPDMWRAIVEEATDAIHHGRLAKVVLARVCEIETAAAIDAAVALDYLAGAYHDSYRFLFEPRPYHAFFGATPELLVRKTGRNVATMALAGSIARGRTAAEDEALAARLLASAKDRYEHQLVVAAIRDSLRGMTLRPAPAEPAILRLHNIQHLLTPIEGQLPDGGEGILPLLCRLHPTPAMGGVPAGAALAFLRRAEPVPRGWYAAPIGWLDSARDGAFAVAIRSAVTQHDRAWLYAGAGIVGDSQPDAEWAETALKFQPMLGALGAEGKF